MPAFYAHDRFGEKVHERLDNDLKNIVSKYYTQFEIGLQGPDIFFFYKPYIKNKVVTLGKQLHSISAQPFFEKSLQVIKEKGRDTKEYAYLLGFICHYILDSECHPYVDEMIKVSNVQHLEIEEEFDKKLMRLDNKDPFTFLLADLVPIDDDTVNAISVFYDSISNKEVNDSLVYLKRIKQLFTRTNPFKYNAINTLMKISGKYAYLKGLMYQVKDNRSCYESNDGLMRRFNFAIKVAYTMLNDFDNTLQTDGDLNLRFNRTFE